MGLIDRGDFGEAGAKPRQGSIAVIGAGAWGTALAVNLAQRLPVRLFVRDGQQRSLLQSTGENRRYLPQVRLPNSITLPETIEAATDGSEIVLLATPSAALPEVLLAIPAHLPVLGLCKGFIFEGDGVPVLTHHFVQKTGRPGRYGALSGPSFAVEVAAGLPTALTLASSDLSFAQKWAARLRAPTLRIYSSDDLVGVEVGGAVKNVLAIAAGISDGLGFGGNARAALVTRGLAELGRLSLALGGKRETLMGLSGMGDLVLTCTGDLSRNRRVGIELAAGKGLSEVLSVLGHVAEGVPASQGVYSIARSANIEMPICSAVHAVLFNSLAPREAVIQLLQRQPGGE